jgi:hypothetical protein
MMLAADELRHALGSSAMRRVGRDFREAFIAARLAEHRGARSVRLLTARPDEPTPDFAIHSGENELWFESTEIDRPNRRRGTEEVVKGFTAFAEEEWTSPEALWTVTRERVLKKVGKQYAKCEGLVVWNNAFPIERASQLTNDWWESACAPARNRFSETWVYTSGAFLRLF